MGRAHLTELPDQDGCAFELTLGQSSDDDAVPPHQRAGAWVLSEDGRVASFDFVERDAWVSDPGQRVLARSLHPALALLDRHLARHMPGGLGPAPSVDQLRPTLEALRSRLLVMRIVPARELHPELPMTGFPVIPTTPPSFDEVRLEIAGAAVELRGAHLTRLEYPVQDHLSAFADPAAPFEPPRRSASVRTVTPTTPARLVSFHQALGHGRSLAAASTDPIDCKAAGLDDEVVFTLMTEHALDLLAPLPEGLPERELWSALARRFHSADHRMPMSVTEQEAGLLAGDELFFRRRDRLVLVSYETGWEARLSRRLPAVDPSYE